MPVTVRRLRRGCHRVISKLPDDHEAARAVVSVARSMVVMVVAGLKRSLVEVDRFTFQAAALWES